MLAFASCFIFPLHLISASILYITWQKGKHGNGTFSVSCCIIRPHRSITYVDSAYCYRPSSVVCRSVCHTSEPDRDAIWVEDSGGPRKPCIRWGPDLPMWSGNFEGENERLVCIVKYGDTLCHLYKNGWTDRFAVCVVDSGGPKEAQVQSYSPGFAKVHPIGIRTLPVLSPAESLWTWVYRPWTCPGIGRQPSCFNRFFVRR